MTSYFEIGGQVIEVLEGVNDVAWVTGRQTAKQHRARSSVIKESKKAMDSFEKQASSDSPDDVTLFEHWKKTSFHNLDRFSDLSRRQQIWYLKNPHKFAIWGIGGIVEVIGMHYDYVTD